MIAEIFATENRGSLRAEHKTGQGIIWSGDFDCRKHRYDDRPASAPEIAASVFARWKRGWRH